MANALIAQGIQPIGRDLPQIGQMLYQRDMDQEQNRRRNELVQIEQAQMQRQNALADRQAALADEQMGWKREDRAAEQAKAQLGMLYEGVKGGNPQAVDVAIDWLGKVSPMDPRAADMFRKNPAYLVPAMEKAAGMPGALEVINLPGYGVAITQGGEWKGGRPTPAPQQVAPTAEERNWRLYQSLTPEQRVEYERLYGRSTAAAKPLPVGALRIVDEAKQAVAAASDSKVIVDKAVKTLQDGKVQLGAVRNLESRTRNFAGASDQNSRAYADIRQTLEKLRNNYLLLAKGVQTEGDAQRAWNSEIGENVQNDNALALQQLTKAQAMIDRALEAQNSRIQTVYDNFGAEPPASSAPKADPLGIR